MVNRPLLESSLGSQFVGGTAPPRLPDGHALSHQTSLPATALNVSELIAAALNTLSVIGICAIVAIPAGLALAIFLLRTDVVGRKMAWIVLGSQIAVPLYVFAGGWSAGVGIQGWMSVFRVWFPASLARGLPDAASYSDTASLLAVAMVHALAAIPWVALLAAFGLLWSDRSQEELALLDGGWRGLVWRGLLPRLRPWILAAGIWCAVPVMTEMVVSNLFQVPTLAELIYLDASRGTMTPLTYLTATGLCMAPLGLAIAIWVRSACPWNELNLRNSHFPAQVVELGRWRLPISSACWTCLFLLVGLPLVNLVAKAGWKPTTGVDGQTSYGWGVDRFLTTCWESLSLFRTEIYWSLILGMAASAIALALASLIYAATGRRLRWIVGFAMALLIAIPGPLVGMLVIWGMNRSDPSWLGLVYDQTLTAPILAQQARLLPVAWVLVNGIIASISTASWEQSRLDGLGHFAQLRFVVLPQTGPLWLATSLLLGVLSIGELSCTILVLPPGVTTVSMRLFEMLHFGMRHQDSGLCGLLLGCGWCVSLVFWKTLRDR